MHGELFTFDGESTFSFIKVKWFDISQPVHIKNVYFLDENSIYVKGVSKNGIVQIYGINLTSQSMSLLEESF